VIPDSAHTPRSATHTRFQRVPDPARTYGQAKVDQDLWLHDLQHRRRRTVWRFCWTLRRKVRNILKHPSIKTILTWLRVVKPTPKPAPRPTTYPTGCCGS